MCLFSEQLKTVSISLIAENETEAVQQASSGWYEADKPLNSQPSNRWLQLKTVKVRQHFKYPQNI